ncbi:MULTISPECIES: Maf-like protein [Phocaeicola]|jgi:septum formation protein|uniref:dTTP/UTP pyrophosphatase n=1 Tax=Phocaeicola plebeius TaxID=310297 RepID=A0A3E4ZD15_9BACT|nr:Maf-like protein [Phocaeicola plebeius]RGM92974.1 septum formation protein Maf [Phocaeicola plebeius]RHD58178.1 septum formation protein Maf [Phocaeicola plebeius]RHH44797.1 septum formation protein Maf [Phocaeicola plebeius]RHK97217.1 septum formation protein Maf [Phocaeicola plebeius]RHL15143.1 septum formation protein Maf [Phocaeicola plebeius]
MQEMKPLENIQHYKIVLASNSPRRRELLSGLNLEYTVRVLPDIDESYPDTLKGEEIPMYISREKAKAYRNSMAEDELIITADTVVCINEKVLGKPRTQEEAKEMLRELSGKTHQVITGVCLMTCGLQRTFSATTQVTFDVLTEDEIEFYVEKFRPLDKAGAYGVQEWIGFVGVSRLEGSYFNVMGLPVQRLYQELKKL